MTSRSLKSRRPIRTVWPRERLACECAMAMACSIEPGSAFAYSSAVKSYFDFCTSHSFPIDPTPDTLSYFTVYMAHYIKPQSVSSYLSGICNQLEPFFPDVRTHRLHWLVTKTLAGGQKMFPSTTSRKRPLTRAELIDISRFYISSNIYNDTLFLAILLTGFHGLLRLGELTWPENNRLQDYCKVILRTSVQTHPKSFQFTLPGHKADRFFEGSVVLIQSTTLLDDAWAPFTKYLSFRDRLFPLRAELWLKEDGSIPTRSWFLRFLRRHVTGDIGGHSLRAGGATALAEARIASHMIQAIGRWSSDTFQLYIRRHPVLLAALIYSSPSRLPLVL